ncbi:SNF2-related protein [Winogradskyella aurantiaca]|uniref:SNF2-related protein n=1 Tax=Winogradskyella aurantiaca TaxID=2219558 RepID=UPI000E1DC4DB|nr:DEAD/DEAH box helicase [Winogradskyella aurantiaca]
MNSSISIFFSNGIIELKGDLARLKKKKKFLHWLNESFKCEFTDDSIMIVSYFPFDSTRLFDFHQSLTEFLDRRFELYFDSSFNAVINNELQERRDFKQFSETARLIWEDLYDVEEFELFCAKTKVNLPNRRLYKLQALSAYHMAFSQNACNFSVPGAGKTSIVYAAYAYLKNHASQKVNKLLIIGPPSSFSPWESEYFECFGTKAKSFRINGEVTPSLKKDVLKGISTENYELILLTYNSVTSLFAELLIFLRAQNNNVMMVCDEAHKFKNITGIWAHHILNLAPYAVSRIVLTGTPAPNGYEDLYNIFKFIYPNKNVLNFRPDYLRRLSQNPLQSEVYQLIENIKPYFVRITKNDLNLPPFKEHPLVLNELNNLELLVYNRLRDYLVSRESNSGNAQSIHFRMIQTCNNLNLLNSALSTFNNDIDFGLRNETDSLEDILGHDLSQKIKALDDDYIPSKHSKVLELVKKLNSRNNKILLWGVFVDSIKKLHSILKNAGYQGGYIIGETKKSNKLNNYQDDFTRESLIEQFKTGQLDYLISNPVVLGESISLHKICHHAIYFEQWYSVAPYVQSRDRIHRVWLDRDLNQIPYETNYYHILTSQRTDTDIHHRVQAKFQRMMDVIEHDIPFFTEDLETERTLLIQNIINDYRHSQ